MSIAPDDLDAGLAPPIAEEAPSEPPPELRYRELVIAQQTSPFPPWAGVVLGITLGLACILAVGVGVAMAQIVKFDREVHELQAEIGDLQKAQARLEEAIGAVRTEMGGLRPSPEPASSPEVDEGAEPPPDDTGAADGSEEPPVGHGRSGAVDIVPPGLIPGGF